VLKHNFFSLGLLFTEASKQNQLGTLTECLIVFFHRYDFTKMSPGLCFEIKLHYINQTGAQPAIELTLPAPKELNACISEIKYTF